MKTVLTIAGFDPSSGAGITADLMVFAAHGLFGTAAVTALTVQSTLGVKASHPVKAEVLADTLDCLSDDLPPAGVKIGMVGSSDNIFIISRYVANMQRSDSGRTTPVVLDPVLSSSSGGRLLSEDGRAALKADLLPLAAWITPNAPELEALTGHGIRAAEDLSAAAKALQASIVVRANGTRIGVFAKGGHLDKPDDFLLTQDGEGYWLRGDRIETNATHGTGCALSSAFLSRLVLGEDALSAGKKAKEYVAEAIRQGPRIGRGKGPMELLWPLNDQPGR